MDAVVLTCSSSEIPEESRKRFPGKANWAPEPMARGAQSFSSPQNCPLDRDREWEGKQNRTMTERAQIGMRVLPLGRRGLPTADDAEGADKEKPSV